MRLESKNKVNYLLRMQREYPHLNKKERLVCEYIREHSKEIIHMSITEVAEICSVSEASIVRLSKKLGYKGFQSMKINIAQDVIGPEKQIYEALSKSDTLATITEKIFNSNVQALKDTLTVLDSDEIKRAVSLILKANRIVFYGVGGSGIVAMDAQHKFIKIGYLPLAFVDSNIQAMSASILQEDDVVIAISHSGASSSIIEAIELAQESGASVITITNYCRSPILKYSDVQLFTSSPETAFKSDALSSRIAELAIIDTLFVGVSFEKYDDAYSNVLKTRKALESKKV